MDFQNTETAPVHVAEIRHRMTNGFQLLQSYAMLQLSECENEEARRRVENVLEQILAVASQQSALAEADSGDLGAFLDLIEENWTVLGAANNVDLIVRRGLLDPMLPHVSRNAARILLEAVANSLEHAFPGRSGGRIEVSVDLVDEQHCRLTVADDGVGLQQDALNGAGGQGTGIVRALAGEIAGTVAWERKSPEGTVLTVEFPVNLPESVVTIKDANA
ncbi:ATP-binding protein [Stappia stellulata]|uniref:ATP-binding protein n=1 Tax=Stappia stellulata TaxID=71235 RepID=UPI00048B4EC8|nr:sensor histidine kinase [Stappia stellulata]